MATYIPNITDTFPEIVPFKPDYDFLMSGLQYKQSQYNAGFNQLNSAYSSLLNSDLTRPINQQRKVEFLKAAEDNLKKVASLDLSLPQNVQLASNIFKPFYEDENIVYDMMYTKKAKQALAEGERFKNCLTEDCAGKYSDLSMQAINYKLREFESADDQSARTVSAPEYVPYINIIAEAEKQLGEKFTNISVDEKSGGYIVTTKNGPKALNVIMQQLSSTLGVDPNVRRYARNAAYVESMNEIVPLAETKYQGDINQAKAEYFTTYSNSLLTNDASKVTLIQRNLDDTESKLDMYNAKLSNGGKLTNQQMAEYEQLSKMKDIYSTTLESTQDRIRIIQDALRTGNFQALESAGIQSRAASYIGDQLTKAADIQAFKNYEVSMEADPYEKSLFDKKLDWSYKQMEKELDFQYKLKEKAVDFDYKMKEKELEEGGYDEFFAQPTTTQAGQTAMENIQSEDRAVYNQTWKSYSSDLNSVIASGMNINDQNIKSAFNKMLSSEGVTLKDLQAGKLGTGKLRAIHGKVNELLTKYPELNAAISAPLRKANDSRQMLDATDASIAKNNKAVVNQIIADKAVGAEDKEVFNIMFDNSGRLKDRNSAYKAYVAKYGTGKLINLRNKSFAGQEMADLFGVNKNPQDIFNSLYDDAKEDFDEKYANYAINTQSYIPVGGIGLGGGGGVTTDYVISGVADPKRVKSKQTLALFDITNNLAGAKITIGSPTAIREQSGDNFEDINTNDAVANYVNNLRANMRTNKETPVAYSYSALGLGSKNYGTLHIKPSANDKTLKALKDSDIIDKEQFGKIISEGITVVIPKSNLSNTFLNTKTSVNNREVILKTSGKYNYYNPKIMADITFTMQEDGTIIPSGTLKDTRTNKLNFVPTNPIDVATFNSMLFGLDNYN